MQRKIAVLGSINQDLVIQMDRIPLPGETLFGNTLRYFPGGKGANQAIAAKKLNGAVLFLGKVGDDLFGNNLRTYLRDWGLTNTFIAFLRLRVPRLSAWIKRVKMRFR